VYADDVALWASANTPDAALRRLTPALHQAVRWGRKWRIAFNPAKTQVGFFSRRTRWTPDLLAPPRVLGVELHWAPTVDLLGVRLDRRLSFAAHVRRATQRLAPKIASLRRWTWAYPAVPAWVGALLAKTIVRPAYLYAAPVLQVASYSALEKLERLERRTLRAGLRRGLAFPVDQLYAAARVPDLRPHLRTLGARFLLRTAERQHRRILAAFASWAPQRSDRARKDVLLERLFALLDHQDREDVRRALFDLGIFPGEADERRRGRCRAADPDLWGVSPFP
jgi:hypothetical protein